jgi:hypothetical protein
LAGDRALIPP